MDPEFEAGSSTMGANIRILTWNCRRASGNSGLWDYLLELAPDVALLQDYGVLPSRMLDHYTHATNITVDHARDQAVRHMSGVLFKGTTVRDLQLPAPVDWVARELETLGEYFTAKAVTLQSGVALRVLSVYSPAWPLDPGRMKDLDTTGIQLTHSRRVWATELMWATLASMQIANEEPYVVAGDLNSSETFDLGPRGPQGNREIMQRMAALGFYDCLRMFKGKLTPTFRTPRGGAIIHQLDHLYVTPMLLSRLAACDVGSAQRVLHAKPMLSDHLPIVADFNWPG